MWSYRLVAPYTFEWSDIPEKTPESLGDRQVLQALRLSLVTSVAATLVIVALGTPTAWLLATRSFTGKRLVEVLVDLPMVLPPTVAGFALLMAFGRMGIAGRALEAFGVSLPFTTLGVVAAQVFMAAPFYVAAARAGFVGVDRRLTDVASTLRASETFTSSSSTSTFVTSAPESASSFVEYGPAMPCEISTTRTPSSAPSLMCGSH